MWKTIPMPLPRETVLVHDCNSRTAKLRQQQLRAAQTTCASLFFYKVPLLVCGFFLSVCRFVLFISIPHLGFCRLRKPCRTGSQACARTFIFGKENPMFIKPSMSALSTTTCRYRSGAAVSYTTDTAKQHIPISRGATYSNQPWRNIFRLWLSISALRRSISGTGCLKFPYYVKLLTFCILSKLKIKPTQTLAQARRSDRQVFKFNALYKNFSLRKILKKVDS